MNRSWSLAGAFVAASAVLLSTGFRATTRDVACSGTITTALQTAINNSVDGDVVNISAGTCNSGRISWTNKNITVRGQGPTATNIGFASGGFAVTVTSAAKAQFRISGIRMYGSTSSANIIFINSENATTTTSGWRIDNNHLDYTGAVSSDPFVIWGNSYGLVDHNKFQTSNPTNILFAFFQTALGEQNWGSPTVDKVGGWFNLSQPSQYGTYNAVYFEDNTWDMGNTGSARACFDASSGGARVVFRYNTMIGCYIYNHWVRANDLDVFQWEVYNNKFIGNSWGNGAGEVFFRSESGTGVMFNNTISGYTGVSKWFVNDRRADDSSVDGGQFGTCNGSRAWDGNAGDPSAPGWPCLAQIGRGFGRTYAQIVGGSKLPSLPIYAWNNGTQDQCSNPSASGSACTNTINVDEYFGNSTYVKSTAHPNGERDFVNNGTTAMPGYAPTAYPHPLVSGTNPTPPTTPAPAPPTAVRIIRTSAAALVQLLDSTLGLHP